jgi:hypothetical protein
MSDDNETYINPLIMPFIVQVFCVIGFILFILYLTGWEL